VNTIARIGVIGVAALAVGTLAACHHAKTATDAQLTKLLRSERAQPNDPRAPIDPGAVGCLRAWSGDADLAKPLPPAAVSDATKAACRKKLDDWIADATRNPDKFAFDDVSAPATVRQAIALLEQHRATAALPMPGDRPPAAMMGQNPVAPPPVVLPKGPVDVSAATAGVSELDGLCKQAKDAAAAGSTAPIVRYAPMCDRRIAQLRDRISELSANGGTSREAEMLNDNVRRMLVFGRQLAATNAPTATTKPAKPAKPNH
jgi:hypothetical protein